MNRGRMEELFVRYWDNTLSDAEFSELEALLSANNEAREHFQLSCLFAVAATERQAIARSTISTHPIRLETNLSSHRRKFLRYIGGGVAAGLAGWFLLKPKESNATSIIRVSSARGRVALSTNNFQPVIPGTIVPSESTISTLGYDSNAMLGFSDGTSVCLTGDSALTVREGGRKLFLDRGTLTAEVQPVEESTPSLTLATSEAVLTMAGGASLDIGRVSDSTEVGVQQGRIAVSSPTDGSQLTEVRPGELLIVKAGGASQKQPIPTIRDQFGWDLTSPLPGGWIIGHREEPKNGPPVVVPDFHLDPFYSAKLWQIRSNKAWTRGLVRLFPDSTIQVRCQVERTGTSEISICVRTLRSSQPTSGVLGVHRIIERTPGFHDIEIRVDEMLDDPHAPQFGPPWVGFLVIFNTYSVDLGLRVAGFRVSRPGSRELG